MTSEVPMVDVSAAQTENASSDDTDSQNPTTGLRPVRATKSSRADLAPPAFENVPPSFWKMTAILCLKNARQQAQRRAKGWLCKVLCPVLCFAILAIIRSVVNVSEKKANYALKPPCRHCSDYDQPEYITNYSIRSYEVMPQALCVNDNEDDEELYLRYTPGYLAFAPDPRILMDSADPVQQAHGQAIMSILDILNDTWNPRDYVNEGWGACEQEWAGPCWCNASSLPFQEGLLIRFFESSADMDEYTQTSVYGIGYDGDYNVETKRRPIGTGIVFNTEEFVMDDENEQVLEWSYRIRQNLSYVPNTDRTVNQFDHELSGLYWDSVSRYDHSRFIKIQTMLDYAITEYIATEIANQTSEWIRTGLQLQTRGYHVFPAASYEKDFFWVYMAGMFRFFMMIAFIRPFSGVASALVDEKALKTKEGMKMMGATNSTYWAAWYLWFWAEFTFIIVGCTLVAWFGNVFAYSDLSLIFIWLYFFGLAVMAFGTLVSTIFDNSKTASIMSTVILIGANMAGNYGAGTAESTKGAICLLAPSCLAMSTATIEKYESGLIGVNWDNWGETYDDFKFQTAVLMMGLDALIYILLALYLDRVWPSQYGTRDPFYFLCLPSFWCPPKPNSSESTVALELNDKENDNDNDGGTAYEALPEQLKGKQPAIQIRNLFKIFNGGLFESKEVRAVDGISLDMFLGEVFCLLGHNGAGKTTTIGMLTGLLEVSAGHAYITGYSIEDEMRLARKSMGVCPQHDTLWPRLTVIEHLYLFAKLKGVPPKFIENEVAKTLRDVGLVDKKDNYPPDMSGGQRRKLSLGIALIGQSQIVFLDEPTSGMDPQSRRVTWDLIEKEKQNRLIILTTHYMDEADLLGDRIAIMSSGKIKCVGSPLFLKRFYGAGYTFTVGLKIGVKAEDVHGDIDDVVLKVPGSERIAIAGGEISYRLAFDQSSTFADMFESIDSRSEQIGINTYGISVTTLEEVFMKIESEYHGVGAGAAHTDKGEDGKDDDNPTKNDELEMFRQPTFAYAEAESSEIVVFFVHLYAILYKRMKWSLRDFRGLCYQVLLPLALAALGLGIQRIKIPWSSPNLELSVAQYYSPSSVSIPFANFTGNTNESNFFYDDPTFKDTYPELDQGSLVDLSVDFIADDYDATFFNWKDQLLKARNDRSQVNYNAFYFSLQEWNNQSWAENQHFLSVSVGTNVSAYHSLPTGYNLFSKWLIKNFLDNDANIRAYAHPLKSTTSEKAYVGAILGMWSALFLAIAFAFVPVGAIYNVVSEKKNMQKHQQLVSGVSIWSYWVGNYIADFVIAIPTCLFVFSMVHLFDADSFLGAAQGPFLLDIVLYILSVLPFTYLLSKFFASPDKAVNTIASLYIFLGLILTILSWVLDSINDDTKEANKYLIYVWRSLPTFCMAQTLINIGLYPLAYSQYSRWNYKLYSIYFVSMACQAVVYFTVFILSEWLSTFPEVLSKMGLTVDVDDTRGGSIPAPVFDEDVQRERDRIKSAVAYNEDGVVLGKAVEDTVVLAGLRKVYRGVSMFKAVWEKITGTSENLHSQNAHKVAVRDVYFGVPQGEVFGFLGVNGAGKTTTLKLLTGEVFPSKGLGFINRVSISNQNVCRRFIGYCPQFDAIFGLLSAYEHLRFYGLIKGLRGEELERQIDVLINALSLQKYKHRRAGTYSGGNKRKLSAAIAMMGNPPVIFMDEPSTGMDPVSRRHMWEFISATMEGRCVILTTHSMEECEALCHRLGIMVDGQLQCLGTPQHLKSRFGKGYQLDLLLDMDELEKSGNPLADVRKQVSDELARNFSFVNLIEANQGKMTFEIDSNSTEEENDGNGIQSGMSLADMFRILENVKSGLPIVSYALNQTTLEQIFMRLAKKAGAKSEF